MEDKVYEYFNVLRGRYAGYYTMINSLKVISFVSIIAKREGMIDKISFESHSEMNNSLILLSDKTDDNVSVLLKDIIVTGILNACEELDKIYKDMVTLSESRLLSLNQLLYNEFEDKYAKEAGARTTNSKISELVCEYVKDISIQNVLDICSGEGNFLSTIGKYRSCIELFGFELNAFSALLCKLRLALQNCNYKIDEDNVFNVEMHDKYDLVFSEFPWGVRPSENIVIEEKGIVNYYNSKSKADWIFINKAINSMNDKGKAIALSLGSVLFGKPDTLSRKQVLDKKLLETVILLPAGILPWTNVNCYLLVFSHRNDQIKFIDASECFIQQNKSKLLDVQSVMHLINSSEDNEFVRNVSIKEIIENDYNLNVNNYLGDNKVQLINPVKLDEIAEVISGYQYTTKTVQELPKGEGNVIVLKGTNISSGEIDLDNTISININEKKVEKYLIKENDILVSTKGTAISLAIVNDTNGCKIIPNNILTIIRVKNGKINPIYLFSFLNSDTGKKLIKQLQNGSIIMNVSRKALLSMEVPIFDIDTQETIANKYILLKKQLEETLKRMELLTYKINNIYEDEVMDDGCNS